MSQVSEKYEAVALKLLETAEASLDDWQTPSDLVRIAEAIAWVRSPGQPHGGQSVQSS